MSLWLENPPYVAYYFGSQYFAFREEGTKLIAEVGPLLSDEKSLVTLVQSIFKKYPIPESHQHSMKLSVQWLLKEGYAPRLKGEQIKFYSAPIHLPPPNAPQTSIASSSSHQALSLPTYKSRMDRALPYFDLAIEHYCQMIATVEGKRNEPPIPVLPIMLGQTIVENLAQAHKFLRKAQKYADRKDPHKAILRLTSAFAFTANSEDYKLLPRQYIALQEPLKAILACIYLARRKIKEGQPAKAQKWVREASELTDAYWSMTNLFNPFLNVVVASCWMMQQERDVLKWAAMEFKGFAFGEGFRTKKTLTERTSEESLRYLACALDCCPQKWEYYNSIAKLFKKMSHPPLTALFNLYIKGILEFYTSDPSQSKACFEKAIRLKPGDLLPVIAYLSRIEETHPDRLELCSSLTPEQQVYLLQTLDPKAFQEALQTTEQELQNIKQAMQATQQKLDRLQSLVNILTSRGSEDHLSNLPV